MSQIALLLKIESDGLPAQSIAQAIIDELRGRQSAPFTVADWVRVTMGTFDELSQWPGTIDDEDDDSEGE